MVSHRPDFDYDYPRFSTVRDVQMTPIFSGSGEVTGIFANDQNHIVDTADIVDTTPSTPQVASTPRRNQSRILSQHNFLYTPYTPYTPCPRDRRRGNETTETVVHTPQHTQAFLSIRSMWCTTIYTTTTNTTTTGAVIMLEGEQRKQREQREQGEKLGQVKGQVEEGEGGATGDHSISYALYLGLGGATALLFYYLL